MKKFNTKYWMLNVTITALQKELDALCLQEFNRFPKPEIEADQKEIHQHIEGLKTNEFHDIGKANLTLQNFSQWRDEWSKETEQALCKHDGEIKKHPERDRPLCTQCDKTLSSWYCPNSPDHCCHYHSKEVPGGYAVELISGAQYKILKHYTKEDHRYENEDTCIFCGHPDERK